MSIKRIEPVESFPAVSNTGKIYRINIYQKILDCGDSNNPNAETPGNKYAKTDGNMDCNRVDDNTWKILDPVGSIIEVKRMK